MTACNNNIEKNYLLLLMLTRKPRCRFYESIKLEIE